MVTWRFFPSCSCIIDKISQDFVPRCRPFNLYIQKCRDFFLYFKWLGILCHNYGGAGWHMYFSSLPIGYCLHHEEKAGVLHSFTETAHRRLVELWMLFNTCFVNTEDSVLRITWTICIVFTQRRNPGQHNLIFQFSLINFFLIFLYKNK